MPRTIATSQDVDRPSCITRQAKTWLAHPVDESARRVPRISGELIQAVRHLLVICQLAESAECLSTGAIRAMCHNPCKPMPRSNRCILALLGECIHIQNITSPSSTPRELWLWYQVWSQYAGNALGMYAEQVSRLHICFRHRFWWLRLQPEPARRP